MRITFFLVSALFFMCTINTAFSQEWKNQKIYRKETGNVTLQDGCWLKRDRKKKNKKWEEANRYNLSVKNGYLKYTTITQIRDLYLWFDRERMKQGHDIKAAGIAAVVAGQLSNFDNWFIRTFVVRNREVVWFGNEGSKKIIQFAFPLMKEVYFSEQMLKGQKAREWDIEKGKIEQCKIMEAIYNELSPKAILKLEKMAKGKGIYNLGVPEQLKFEGEITNCKTRYEHAFTKVNTYYINRKE